MNLLGGALASVGANQAVGEEMDAVGPAHS